MVFRYICQSGPKSSHSATVPGPVDFSTYLGSIPSLKRCMASERGGFHRQVFEHSQTLCVDTKDQRPEPVEVTLETT